MCADVRPLFDEEGLRVALSSHDVPWARVEVRDALTSTNSELTRLIRADPDGWPSPAVLLAHHQTGGHGRLGRVWHTPAGTALTMSVFVRTTGRGGESPARLDATSQVTWLPLIAGLASVRGIRSATGLAATLKWPNDVLLPMAGEPDLTGLGGHRKVAGILAEVVPGHGVVIGMGVNVLQDGSELPVPTATSLRLALTAEPCRAGDAQQALSRDAVAVAILAEWGPLLERWRAGASDEEWAAAVEPELLTLGSAVRVELTGGDTVSGTAVALAADGALVIDVGEGIEHVVRSGDVFHLRAENDPRPGPHVTT